VGPNILLKVFLSKAKITSEVWFLSILMFLNDDFLLMLFSTTARPTPPPTTTRPLVTCAPGHSPCRTAGQCVPSSAICDGRFDCQDFSDETDCGEFS
jgi:hypothetical protein